MALRILRAVFGGEDSDPGGWGPVRDRTYPLTAFQEAAVARVRRTLDGRGGVLLADAVGLGKTYIALAVVEERLRAGSDVVVIVPAALRPVWSKPLRRVARAAGRPDDCRILSHAQLSRGATPPEAHGPRLIVVDEAHRFRNPAALRYRALARLMAAGLRAEGTRSPEPRATGTRAGDGALAAPSHRPELLLVTATPINNALTDLYHLTRLFLLDDGLRGAGVPSLRAVFETVPPDPAGLGILVRELVVRRTRPMVERRHGAIRAPPAGPGPAGRAGRAGAGARRAAVARFPHRAPPRIHRYLDPAIAAHVAAIEALELAAYGTAAPLASLGLLKRMDSSPAAFVASLRRLRRYLDAVVEAGRAGRVLQPGYRTLHGDGDPLQLSLLGVVADRAPPDLDLDALVASSERDRRAVDALIRGSPGGGAKADALIELLEELAGDRVLVFTEYRDTARSLWRTLAGRVRIARIDGSGAWLGTQPAGRRTVVERFAPVANRRPPPPERERVDVLIATDVLAEGLNLQDARHVVSYDLPWNPVRLLQRIGRIDRLGSHHDEVVPHLFVPGHGLDAVLGLTGRLRTKLHGISTALGEPQADELLQGLAAGHAERVETAIRAVEDGDGDPWERLRTLWQTAQTGHAGDSAPTGTPAAPPPSAPESHTDLHVWAELRDHHGTGRSAGGRLWAVVLVADPLAVRAGRPEVRLLEVTTDGEARPLGNHGADLLARALAERGCEPLTGKGRLSRSSDESDRADPSNRDLADRDRADPPRELETILRAASRHEATLRARSRAPTALSARGPAARLARRVRRLMADAGAGLSPGVVAQAEALLRALADPLPPAVERAVARILDSPDKDGSTASDPATLVSTAAAVLRSGGAPGSGSGASIPDGIGEIRAVLVASPKPG